MSDDPNGKSTREMVVDLTISAAVQENKLDTVITTLKDHCEREDKWRDGIDLRVRTVETEQARQKVDLKHTIRNVTGFNVIYTTVAAFAAGLFKSWKL